MEYLVLAILGGALFLHIFYRAVAVSWPATYFAADSLMEYRVSRHPWRYLAFRFAPVFVTCVFVGVSLDRGSEDVLVGVIGLCALHVALTSGRGVAAQLSARGGERSGPLLVLYVAVSIGVLATGAIALGLDEYLAPLVPGVEELSAALWTAVFAGVAGAYFVRVAAVPSPDPTALFRDSRRTIDDSLWSYGEHAARDAGADPLLLQAIMLVENLQRPKWFRTLERLKGKFAPSGSYGITQITAEAPLSDRESVDRCIAERLVGVVVMGQFGHSDYDILVAFAKAYNPQPAFVENFANAYGFLEYPPTR